MYIDPGTGSVVIQAILAVILGMGVLIKIFWKKIRLFFGKKEFEETKTKDDE